MFKKYLSVILIVLGFQFSLEAQNSDIYSIYLIRHSEKDLSSDNYSDPPLTSCGEGRSESLKNFFKEVNLEAIYSTDYTRTKNTAQPTAESKGLEVKEYASFDLEEFSEILIKKKQDALVVGHSNTTGVLAGLLVDEEIGEFDLDIYNRIYQVVICENSRKLYLLHSAFDCND
jgi:broad specificity phosphatase PhoE